MSTVPQPGDWSGVSLSFLSDASFLDTALIRYAKTGLSLQAADATLNQVSITDCSFVGLDLNSSSHPTVTGSSFSNNDFAVYRVPFDAIPGFLGNSAAGNTRGDYMFVLFGLMTTDLTIGPENSLGSRPFVLGTSVTVPPGLTLTLDPGTIVKFGPGPFFPCLQCTLQGIDVQGTLVADQVTVTALEDDSVAGDTNKDGSLLVPVPGEWGSIVFQPGSGASSIDGALLRYGGQKNLPPFITSTIVLASANVLLDGVSVEDGADAALDLGANSFPTVRNCSFARNTGLAVKNVPLGAVAGFTNNTAGANHRGLHGDPRRHGPVDRAACRSRTP